MTGLAERDGSVAEPLAPVAPARSALAAWAKPLRVHLSVVIVALLIAISAPLMWLTYSQGTREAIDAAESQMRLLSQQATSLYEAMLSDGASVVKMASVLPSMAAEPPAFLDAKKAFMMEALKGSVHLDGVYAGYPGGSFVQLIDVERNERWRHDVAAPAATAFAMRIVLRTAQGVTSTWQFLDRAGAVLDERVTADASYDPRRRPWYRAGLGAPGPVSLGPYVSASTNSLTYSVAMPMAADPAIVLGADVLIETIGHLLAERAVSENAVGFAFDDDGTLIAHSDPQVMARLVDSYLGAARADASAEGRDPTLAAVRGLLAGGREDGIVEFDVAGSPYLARLSSTATSGLLDGNRIVVAAPLADFTAESIRLVQKTVAIAAVLVLAGVLVALALARLISRALVALADDARHIGNLDFQGAPVRHSWISEINLLAGALGSARDAIRTFALYVPRELVRRIVASGQAEAGRAVRQEVTILFTDIQDFTTISERHSPEDVVDMLTGYFQRMNEIVERNNGIIVQFLGDSVYAMWNAPIPDEHHVRAACRCTLELRQAVDDFNAAARLAGRPPLVTRFGLHTGIAVVGSVGAEARRQYTAMGDTVNVASRLEGMNKAFGTSILVSATIRSRCERAFRFRPLGQAHAKGREEDIEVYELVGFAEK
ncbi:MAG: adenylate/guanylate cyclase domain-containing protein [Mesorhizobium sp.]